MRGKTEPVGTSQNYQRFAWGTLALAAVVALAGTDRSDAPTAAPLVATTVADATPATPKMARPAFAMAEPQPAEEPEQGDGGETESATGDAAPAAPAVPGNQPAEAGTTAAAGPDTAQPGQMVSASRDRSGGVAQGDDPAARRAN